MNITNILLGIIILILLKQFYPAYADNLITVVIIAFVLYAGFWLVTRFPERWKKHRAEKLQKERDEKEYWDYRKKHDAIRAKFDPKNEWNEITSIPREYLEEIRRLNIEHRGMLQRRNGWKAEDFRE